MKRVWIASGITAGLAAAGLGLWAQTTPAGNRSPTDRALLHQTLAVGSVATVGRPYSKLTDLLPNTKHVGRHDPQQQEVSVVDSVVRGHVAEVAEYSGFVEAGPATTGKPGAQKVPYNAPEADWRAVRVHVAVAETLSGADVKSLVFSLPLMGRAPHDGEADSLERAFTELGDIVVLSKGLPGGPEFLGLARELPDRPFGIATVSDEGQLTFPFADDGDDLDERGVGDPAVFVAGIDTLDELRAELRKPPSRKIS